MNVLARSLTTFLSLLGLTIIALTACTAANTRESVSPPPGRVPTENTAANACPVSEPLWIKPPEDSAVQGTPDYGYYFVNEDRSIWASAWWTDQEENYLLAGEEGIKVGWFRPEGLS